VADNSRNVEERLSQLEEDQATVATLQQSVTELHQDIVSLRRELYRVEGQARGERIQLAQQGPIGGAAGDDNAVLALKLAGRSPSISSHIAQIGQSPKITRVASVLAATAELNMELATWKGTPYGLDRATHEPLCRLIVSRFPETLVSELRYNTTFSSAGLKHPTNYHKMMQALLEVAMQLDQGTASTLEYIQQQHQGSRTIIEHITAMRFLTDLIPPETQASIDFRRALWNTFNYHTRSWLASLNKHWKTTNDLPDADTLYQAACEAQRFYAGEDKEQEQDVPISPSTAAVYAIQAPPSLGPPTASTSTCSKTSTLIPSRGALTRPWTLPAGRNKRNTCVSPSKRSTSSTFKTSKISRNASAR
jgi:hypothetical protein